MEQQRNQSVVGVYAKSMLTKKVVLLITELGNNIKDIQIINKEDNNNLKNDIIILQKENINLKEDISKLKILGNVKLFYCLDN